MKSDYADEVDSLTLEVIGLKSQRDDLLARVKELEASNSELMEGGKFIAQLQDDYNKSLSNIHTLTWEVNNLTESLHQRDTALVAAREALEKSVRVMSAIKHATEHNQPIPWNGVCERLSAAIEASKSAMHPNET